MLNNVINFLNLIESFISVFNFKYIFVFYSVMELFGIIFAVWLQSFLCLPIKAPFKHSPLNIYEIAYFTGGNGLLISSLITSLVIKNYVSMVIVEKNKYAIIPLRKIDNSLNPLEIEVLQKVNDGYTLLSVLSSSLSSLGCEIELTLKRYGLHVSDDQYRVSRSLPTKIFLLLFVMGIYLVFLSIFIDLDLFWSLLFYSTIPLAFANAFASKQRSRYGKKYLLKLKSRFKYLKSSKINESDIAFAVAVFGEVILCSLKDYESLYYLKYMSSDGIPPM